MLNMLADLKRLVGVDGTALEMDDSAPLGVEAAGGRTAFEFYLEALATSADLTIAKWLETTVPALAPNATNLRAELTLVQAEICLQFGFIESVMPDEIQAGGSEGQRLRMRKLSLEERGERAAEMRSRARTLLTGVEPVGFAGVL